MRTAFFLSNFSMYPRLSKPFGELVLDSKPVELNLSGPSEIRSACRGETETET